MMENEWNTYPNSKAFVLHPVGGARGVRRAMLGLLRKFCQFSSDTISRGEIIHSSGHVLSPDSGDNNRMEI